MSVRTWDTAARWTTNYSAIAYSTDGGETWTVDPETVRSSGWLRSSSAYVPGDEHFQQNALVYGSKTSPPQTLTAEPGQPLTLEVSTHMFSVRLTGYCLWQKG